MKKNRKNPLKTISLFLIVLILVLPNMSVYGLVGSYSEKPEISIENQKQQKYAWSENLTFVEIAGFLGTVTLSNFTNASGIGVGTSSLLLKKDNSELIEKEGNNNNNFNDFSKFDN